MDRRIYLLSGMLVLIGTACSQSGLPIPVEEVASSSESSPEAPDFVVTSASTASPTNEPTATSDLPKIPVTGQNSTLFYDEVAEGTSAEKKVVAGEDFKSNRFERPFSQFMEEYQPDLDIFTFTLLEEGGWFVASLEMAGPVNAGQSRGSYGVELDVDRDGIGDYLIWAQAPDDSTWSADVQILEDANHDSAGEDPFESDAPFLGDGYESIVLKEGVSLDHTDLALIRLDPDNVNTVQLAFQKSLLDSSFLWSAWADGGLKNPGLFSYNDRITEEQAGSPLQEDGNYPIGKLYSLDSTCRAPFGFEPIGTEPLICVLDSSPATSQPPASNEEKDEGPVPTPIPPDTPTATELPIPLTATATQVVSNPISPDTPTNTLPPIALSVTPASQNPQSSPTTGSFIDTTLVPRVPATATSGSRSTPLPPKNPTATELPGPTGIPSTSEGKNMPTK